MSKIVILHGLGQTTKDWQEVVNYIKNDYQLIDLFETIEASSVVTIEKLYSDISKKLDNINEPFYLCGLSLGGLLTLMYGTEKRNPKLEGIIVSGAIYKEIPKWINLLQCTVFRILPKSKFEEFGINRKQMISLVKSVNVNLEEELKNLNLPTLIMCGEQDKANLKSSDKLNRLIPNSNFSIIKGGGHELNKDSAWEFSKLVNQFIH